VAGNGTADFFSSWRFSIVLPAGAILVTASGTSYVTQVPEPSPLVLVAIGLAAICFARRERWRAPDRFEGTVSWWAVKMGPEKPRPHRAGSLWRGACFE
jgi:hypothetical protein